MDILTPMILTGFLSVWTRECDLTTQCPSPEIYGSSVAVEGEISAPPSPGYVTVFRQGFESDLLNAQFNIYWSYPQNQKPYITTQVSLFDPQNGKALGQCASYTSVEETFPFPAGSCSTFIEKDGVTTQVGLSFSRIAF